MNCSCTVPSSSSSRKDHVKRDTAAHHLHERVGTRHSRNDLQLLANAHGAAFASQLGQVLRHVPEHVRPKAPATLPQDVPALVNVEEKHPKIFRGENSL
mmetsp:Transcript_47194/g.100390  ORF Transcript_47194/g.100390 Transcript_47194/m.100390 type:complete len:99 (-) Transcript_47194:271-567(-)